MASIKTIHKEVIFIKNRIINAIIGLFIIVILYLRSKGLVSEQTAWRIYIAVGIVYFSYIGLNIYKKYIR